MSARKKAGIRLVLVAVAVLAAAQFILTGITLVTPARFMFPIWTAAGFGIGLLTISIESYKLRTWPWRGR